MDIDKEMRKKLLPPLDIRMRCEHCGLSFYFKNEKCNAQKIINKHYRTDECSKQQEMNWKLQTSWRTPGGYFYQPIPYGGSAL